MTHLVRREPWGTIDIDVRLGHVGVRQDWRYTWRAPAAMTPWTSEEQGAYHRAVDRLVWAYWSFRARILVLPAATNDRSAVADHLRSRYPNLGMTLSFDVRRVIGHAQWQATVTKANPDARPLPRAQVNFEARTLTLYSTDVRPHTAARYHSDRMAQFGFSVTAHEFGDALGYGYARGNGEERDDGHPCRDDIASIMNIGTKVRPRHLALVTETLGRMVPGCKFMATVTVR